MKTITFYEVTDGNGGIGKDGNYTFKTAKEALKMATEFKKNPRSHNEKITDENVKYWKSKTYTVIKKTIETEEVGTV